ncbi:MAG TPA: prenyltransferase/squalene oxidase repeat-containing protein [Planctomycetota bacterium]|nr:prenyltransferase/squalene oxidase repeat-containing protein [Planctomycetota bacterium]
MRREPLREASAHTDAAASDEAILEQYVERPTPARDWLEDKIRRAPWWCISFLVHLLALLVLWSWPARSAADGDETVWSPPVNILPPDPPPAIVDPPDLRPDDPPELPEKFNIKDIDQTQLAGGPTEPDLPPIEEPPPQGEQMENLADVIRELTPVIGFEIDTKQLAQVQKRYGNGRDKLYRRANTWGTGTGPGTGPGTGDDTVVTPLVGALMWLMRAQEKDGSWNAKTWEGSSPYRVGMTGLAILAYEGAGFTHQRGRFRHTIARALAWLRENQRRDGSFPWETFYEQGIATMAVCEAYGMTDDPKLRAMAQRAVDYIVKLQPEHGGFRYSGPVTLDEGDMSVTGWQIMAIKSAMLAGLGVPPQAVERSRTFLKNTWRDYGASSYLAGNKPPGSLAITAIGLLCRAFLNDGGMYDVEIGQAADFLRRAENPNLDSPVGGASKQLVADTYYTYYSSLAMFQLGGDQSEHWRSWRTMYRAPLIAAQVHAERNAQGRYTLGSWDPAKHRWGDRGGRVYATALGALCLEAPFRYLPTSKAKP